jgi:hypothetical protein
MHTDQPFTAPGWETTLPAPWIGCRLKSGRRSEKAGADPDSDPDSAPSTSDEEAVSCRRCLHVISSRSQQQVVDGAHMHTFANPEGIVFDIACYGNAWGCGYVGPASSEFTWFVGYRWRIAVCANCLTHLGWRFSSPSGNFFHGLIVSRIVEVST